MIKSKKRNKSELMKLFGSLKFKKGSQELKDEARKEYGKRILLNLKK